MLTGMHGSIMCPQCSSSHTDGICRRCAASSPPIERGSKPPTPLAWILSIIAGTMLLLLLIAGLIAYEFISRANQHRAATAVVVPHLGPVARIDQLTGRGRIYLVQMGPHRATYKLDDFAAWLRSKYALDVQVLSPMSLPPSAWDSGRRQYIAELLYDQIKREHSEFAADPDAYLIGFTDADMYSVANRWAHSFTQRDTERAAVISSARMSDTFWERIGIPHALAERHLETRLRRILLKDVAILYWHLPLNNDPSSLLHQTLDPDLPTEDIYESDLAPELTKWGRLEGEPCIFFGYSAKDGLKLLPGSLIRSCSDMRHIPPDESIEVFQVDLALGLLIDKRMDFYFPDSVPIEFQRATRDGWRGPMGFGISGSHTYDNYLMSADLRQITVMHADGSRYELARVPAWLSALPLVKALPLGKYVDTEYSGRYLELRWSLTPFEHFDLRRFNGEVETYLPCDSPKVLCYLVGFRNQQGQELKFERDSRRRLLRLTSPNKSWVRLNYDGKDRIAEAVDSRGRRVLYGYDEGGRLVRVAYPSGEILRYEYDNTQHLLTFSAAPDPQSPARVLLRNEYEQGRLVKQTLADGTQCSYSYSPPNTENPIRAAIVDAPDGRIFDLEVSDWSSTVRQRNLRERGSRSVPQAQPRRASSKPRRG